MKTPMLNLSYSEKENTKDIRVIPTTPETPSFIVDKKLIDILLGQLVPTNFAATKETIVDMVRAASDMPELITAVEEYFYIYKVSGKLEEVNSFKHDDTFGEPKQAVVLP